MKRALLSMLLLGPLAFAPSAHAQYIGIFMDPEATSCAQAVGDQPWIDLHVVAILEDELTEVHGFQFQITGLPPTWSPANVLWVPDPNLSFTLGSPMFPGSIYTTSGGVNIILPACTGPEPSRVMLGRMVILGAPTPEDVLLRVEAVKLVPPDPDCVAANDCIVPSHLLRCIGGGQILLNGTGSVQPSCQVAVEEATWSTVRQLYR